MYIVHGKLLKIQWIPIFNHGYANSTFSYSFPLFSILFHSRKNSTVLVKIHIFSFEFLTQFSIFGQSFDHILLNRWKTTSLLSSLFVEVNIELKKHITKCTIFDFWWFHPQQFLCQNFTKRKKKHIIRKIFLSSQRIKREDKD